MPPRSATASVRRQSSVLVIWTLVTASAAIQLSGCAVTGRTTSNQQEIDSLRSINTRLASEVKMLSDSLNIFSGVESGQYFRDYRSLQTRIVELNYKLRVCEYGGTVIATELVDSLFEPASANLTDAGRKLLEEALADQVIRLKEGEIRVHGHADTSRPGAAMAKTYPTNWELSAARATAVTRFLVERFGISPNRIAAVSFGDARPVESNLTADGRKMNRRIEIVLM
ncbi:MAG: OmpA family protein [Bacteroidetes bacterium]|nr:OmpA family protein [Bacteroidota bacterium]